MRKTAGIFLSVVMALSLLACGQREDPREALAENHRAWQALPAETRRAFTTLSDLGFSFRLEWYRWFESPSSIAPNYGFHRFAFVETEEAARDGKPGVLYFWPSEDTPELLACWNITFENSQHELTEQGLQYPLDLEQLFERPQVLYDLLKTPTLTAHGLDSIGSRGTLGGSLFLRMLAICGDLVLADSDDPIAEMARFADFWSFRTSFEGTVATAFRMHVLRHDRWFDSMVLVHDETEAAQFPPNVLVALPVQSEDNGHYELALALLNEEAVHQGVNFADMHLVYPITIDDLIDNWESVWVLIHDLTNEARKRVWCGIDTRQRRDVC